MTYSADQAFAEFSRAFDAETKDRPWREVSVIQKKMGHQALNGVIYRTPVDTGRARGNWQTTVGAAAESAIDRVDLSGDATRSAGEAVINSLPPFDVLWLANNLEYIPVLEHGQFDPPDPGPSKDPRPGRFGRVLVSGGYSVQAPQGMVALTVEELTTQFG